MAIDDQGSPDTIGTRGTSRGTGAKERVKSAASAARTAVGDAYDDARDGIADAYATARDKAAEAGRRAADGIDENPAAAVVGALALGAVAAALLPGTEREKRALGAVGGKLNQAAKGAVDAARTAGREKIADLGLDRAKDTVRKLVDDVVAKSS